MRASKPARAIAEAAEAFLLQKQVNGCSPRTIALLARLEAKLGKESAIEELLKSALPLANAETATTVWFALKIGRSTFGIFDVFADEAGRQAHLAGQIAATLLGKAPELLSQPPMIERVGRASGQAVTRRRAATLGPGRPVR